MPAVPNEDDLEDLLLQVYPVSDDPVRRHEIMRLIRTAWEKGYQAGYDAALLVSGNKLTACSVIPLTSKFPRAVSHPRPATIER